MIAENVLISTYWNVNFMDTLKTKSNGGVLISTYWNVNIFILKQGILSAAVLISTYWNVNQREHFHTVVSL